MGGRGEGEEVERGRRERGGGEEDAMEGVGRSKEEDEGGEGRRAVDMIGTTDYATGSFCSSCSIKPTLPGGFWLDGKGCAYCSYDNGG